MTESIIGKNVRRRESNFGPLAVAIGYSLGTTITLTSFTSWLVSLPFDNGIITGVGAIAGLAAAVGTVLYTVPKWFVIRNITTNMFLTQDTLASLLGEKDINVAYGPGTHLCYPWERRLAGNNISLEDAPVYFDFDVMVEDALLSGQGSFRLRPEEADPVTFLESVASVGQEVKDLIIAKIQEFFTTDGAKAFSSTDTAVLLVKVNEYLKHELVDERAQVEQNNGVKISDATVSKLLPSEELQRTLSAISEARAVQKGIEILLGKNREEIAAALKDGSLTQAEVDQVRRDFLTISGNTENIKRQEFDLNVRGLSPETVTALTDLANSAAATAFAAGATSKRSVGRNQGKKP